MNYRAATAVLYAGRTMLRRRRRASERVSILGYERTLASIAERMGITEERARQIQNEALGKMLFRLRQIDPEWTMRDLLLSLARLAIEAGETQPRMDGLDGF